MRSIQWFAALIWAFGLLAVGCAGHGSQTALRPGPPDWSHEYVIRASDLPAPHASASVQNAPAITRHNPLGTPPDVPPHFQVNIFAQHLNAPRFIAIAPDGTAFVALSYKNEIVALRDSMGTGTADVQKTYATGLRQPFGLAFHQHYLYVGNTDSVVRFPYHSGDMTTTGQPDVVVPSLPANGYNNHWTRDVVFSKDGKTMFVSVGSKENVGIDEPRRAAILAFDPDGGNFRIWASGLRNAVGLAICPKNGQLWACVNERDTLGNDLPPDYATSIREGGFYGWPYAYIGPHPDPDFGAQRPDLVKTTITPDVLIQAHSAPIEVAFGTSDKFPAFYRGGAFVSLHGSWNREPRTGYKVIYIPLHDAQTSDGGYVDFMSGFSLPDDTVWGRPAGMAFAKDGALLVCDDAGGKIWRISYKP